MMFIEAVALAAFVRVALRCTSVARLTEWLARGASGPRHATDPRLLHACQSAAVRASRAIAHPTCLFQSLVAFGLLARRSVAVEMHIGATRDAGFGAHAWVTVDGCLLAPAEPREYVVLWRYVVQCRSAAGRLQAA